MTHLFHPLAGRDFEFIEHRQNWGEDRVCLRDENGELFSLPAGWTDAVAADPFVVIAAGRCPFATDDLLAVADLVDRFRARRDSGRDVKTITRERKGDYAAQRGVPGGPGYPGCHSWRNQA